MHVSIVICQKVCYSCALNLLMKHFSGKFVKKKNSPSLILINFKCIYGKSITLSKRQIILNYIIQII